MPAGSQKWTPAPPCVPARGHRPSRSCSERAEHESEVLAMLGEEDDGSFFLIDVVEDMYVCAVAFCPWCGSRLRHRTFAGKRVVR